MPYEIYPRVFFGGESYTHTDECIETFTHVLNVSCEEAATAASLRETLVDFCWIYNEDQPGWPILGGRFQDAIAFLEKALENPQSKVYIHCHEGVNRSAAIAIGFRCLKTGESPERVIQQVRNDLKTPILKNMGFYCQLLEFGINQSVCSTCKGAGDDYGPYCGGLDTDKELIIVQGILEYF
jgi:protein-tyrosine phosphatase